VHHCRLPREKEREREKVRRRYGLEAMQVPPLLRFDRLPLPRLDGPPMSWGTPFPSGTCCASPPALEAVGERAGVVADLGGRARAGAAADLGQGPQQLEEPEEAMWIWRKLRFSARGPSGSTGRGSAASSTWDPP